MKRAWKPDIHVRLSPDEFAAVKKLAQADDRSLAYVVRRIVRVWLKRNPEGFYLEDGGKG